MVSDNETGKHIENILKKVQKGSKNAENYNTGLVGEQLIVSVYKTMPLDKLIKLRFIMNKIIKSKKEYKRINEANKRK